MAADNPINRERWKLNGSHADYWRSSNPYIAAWYRLGENEYPVSAPNLGISENTDSGPRHHHLTTTQAPNTFMRHVSGIAPWSSSGILFGGSDWTDSTVNRALYVDPDYYRDRTDQSTLGYYGVGSAVMSGITIMGWAKVTSTATATTTPRKLWGNIEDTASAADGEWMITITPSTRAIEFTYNAVGAASNPAGAIQTVSTVNDPFNVTDPNEPFFFACQISKGNPASSYNINSGSGILRVFLGTTVSGLRLSNSLNIVVAGTDFWRGDNTEHGITNFTYTLGADPISARGTLNQRHLPSGSIIDEYVIVNDGSLSLERMQHYMNSGIIQSDDDPGLSTFVPTLPGTDDLVAYWTFDNQDGINSSPNTSGIAHLDLQTLGSMGWVAGIRGGSGVRPNNTFTAFSTQSYPASRNSMPHVPAGSGLNYLFPTQDQTWIGWVRSEGTNTRGGAFGWFGAAGQHLAVYWATFIEAVGSLRPQHIDIGTIPSGGDNILLRTIAGTDNSVPNNDARQMLRGHWHLLAVVFDITHGFTRVVYDAKDVYPMLMSVEGLSGFNKQRLIANTIGGSNGSTQAAGFLFTNLDTTDRASYDDWAIYNRVLTLPEMSGYALSGIQVTPVISPIDTSFKRTVGYWKLGPPSGFDPTGISGIRFDDESWYRHHLTRVSGNFRQGEGLNTRLGNTTAEVTFSGSMMSVSRVDCGANLDFSTSGVWASSGFTAGCWMYIPSGDQNSQGSAGTSGLYGDKMFMGAWGQSESDQSWFLGMRDNNFLAAIKRPNISPNYVLSQSGVPFNTPFFIAMKAVPSGDKSVIEIFTSRDTASTTSLELAARDTSIPTTNQLNGAGASGFTLFNAADLNYGFPSGTRMQGAFVYAGSIRETDLSIVKVGGIGNTELGSGSVSPFDPKNISHWKFDRQGAQFQDFGQAQNFLRVINDDGHQPGTFKAIHSSGVVIRDAEYYDTIFNPNPSGLNVASTNKSFTFLTWIKPNATIPTSTAVIMGKGGPDSGVEVFMSANTLRPSSSASGMSTESHNGDLLPGEWNHLAITFDRTNNEYEVIVNGRYAGGNFNNLIDVPENNSGMAIGGRGDEQFRGLVGGTAFSGIMDDTMLFNRVLSLPEISGLAGNSYNFAESHGTVTTNAMGGYISGLAVGIVSGLIGSFMHGMAQDLALGAGYVSGVSGAFSHVGGFIRGMAVLSGQMGSFMHGMGQISGLFGCFIHGTNIVSGFIGSYLVGAGQAQQEFDVTLNFRVISSYDFDARIAVEKTQTYNFDARLGVTHITQPPQCTIELPYIGIIASGIPYLLTVRGSGIAYEGKRIEKARWTFSDFRGASNGVLISGLPTSGLYEGSRVLDTAGWYTVKLELIDSFGYRASCARPFLLLPSGVASGTYINSLPGISLSGIPIIGSTVQDVIFTLGLSGIDTTSGILSYLDFSDGQETLVDPLEMVSGAVSTPGQRLHQYVVPGSYAPVFAASGSWGIVSDSLSLGIDYVA